MPDATVATPSSPSHPPVLPTSPGRAIVLGLFALLSGLGLTGWIERSGPPPVTGSIQTHTTTITAPCQARIVSIAVQPGRTVRAGDPLLTLVDEELERQWAAKQREAAALEAELDQARARAEVELECRIDQINTEIFATRLKAAGYLRDQLDSQVEGLAWQGFLEDYNALSAAGDDVFKSLVYRTPPPDETRILTILRQDAARNNEEVCAAQVELCEHRLQELLKLKAELPKKIERATGVTLAETRLAQVRDEQKRLDEQRQRLAVKAPAYGKVGVLQHREGEIVPAGRPIVDLLDEDRVFLTAPVPSTDVARFPVGTQVALRFPGGELRQGRVLEVPPQTQPHEHPARTNGDGAAVVSIRIGPAGKVWPSVPIGSAVEVRPGG